MNYLALLESGIDNWNQWRTDHPDEICDLSGQDLQEGYFVKGNFSQVNFAGAQLQRACLIGANLQGANLSNANLSGAYMGEANLQSANLTNAQLTETNLNRADFREAILEGVDLVEANIYKARFSEGIIDKKMTLYTRAERDAGIATKTRSDHKGGHAELSKTPADITGSEIPNSDSSGTEITPTDNVIALADRHTTGGPPQSLRQENPKHNPAKAVAAGSVLKFPTEVPERAIRIQPQQQNRPANDGAGNAGATPTTETNTPSSINQRPSKLRATKWLPAIAVVTSLVGLALLILGNNLLFSGPSNPSPKEQKQPPSYSEQTDIQQPSPSAGSPLAAEVSTTDTQWASLEQVQTLENKSPVLAIAASQSSDNGSQDTANNNTSSNQNTPMVISGDEDGNLTLWNQRTGKSIRTLPGHRAAIRTLAISPTNQWLVSGGDDGIKTWNPKTGELAYNLPADNNPTWRVAIDPSERIFISADYNGNITVWQLDNGAPLYRIKTGSVVWDLAIAPDGKSFVSGGDDNRITQWDIDSGEKLRTFDGHSNVVRTVAISPDGETLVSGSWDRTIKLWHLATGELKTTLTGHQTQVESIAISANGKQLASVSADSQLIRWDMVKRQRIDTVMPSTDRLVAVDFATDTQAQTGEYTLISSGKDQTIEVWQPTANVQ